MRLSQLADEERPRERLFRYGAENLSVVELLAILLGTGSRGEDVLAFAASILEEWGGLAGLCRAEPAELTQKKGIKKAKAAALVAALELGKRMLVSEKSENPEWISRVEKIAKETQFCEREKIFALFLDHRDKLMDEDTISYGGLDGAFLDMPVFFRKAIRLNASSVVLAHNHPDGSLSASKADEALTDRIAQGLKLLGVELKGHYITANGSFVKIP